MHGDPLVTIVTPSFNQGRFIGATIESVLSQEYENIEYIVMDGASTDETADVVRPYLDRLTFVSEPDRGQSHAINKGFARARGSIVAWLNSDDVFLPGAIRAAVEAFADDDNVAAVYGEGYEIDEEGAIISRFPHTQHFDRWKLVCASDYILQQTVFFRKSALDAVGPLREDLNYAMDWDILIRLAQRFELVKLPVYMGSLREYGTTKTSQGGAKRAWEIGRLLKHHTGAFLSPGYLIYGFSTYQQLAAEAFERWPKALQPMAQLLTKVATKLCYGVVGRAMQYSQAWHADGWMDRRARVMLSAGSGVAALRGHVPRGIPGLKEQRVTVRHRGRVVACETLRPGDFEIRVPVEETEGDCPVLEIQASETFVFTRRRGYDDRRQLSLRLASAEWVRSSVPTNG